LEPEEDERLTSLRLRNLCQLSKILVPLLSVAIVNIWQEGEYADNLTGVLALVIVNFLLDQFMEFRFDISLVEKFTHERRDTLRISSALVSLFLRISFSLTVVPVQDSRISLDLEA